MEVGKAYKNCTADVLSELMAKHNITQSELSKKTGISQQLISTWLRGQTPRGDWHIERVANFFKVDMSYMLYGIAESTRFN